ncbi:helix-turn-helix domain-containing protein [Hymenobacter psychrotolerans]|uniref:DNA-binding transcriptional regulator, XRE-family HTH domain n=1 Tax=Hymenobacter psychrotolerans DSM 18569 TaxID=1121959 RepID=A0A1M6ULT6_9BACT|nr:DNA-binding transcriptional regulator, XRE-family HTH domain [Hymenobacter psychrotolerans DSM 18569]
MVDRIRELLEAKQLTPTQFADVIGIARPIVSHILSGRNKPSLEVVQKIIAAFPDLAMPWLLTGAGPMSALPSLAETVHAAAPPKKVFVKGPKEPPQAQQDLAFDTQDQIAPLAAADGRFALASSVAPAAVPTPASAAPVQTTATPPVAARQVAAAPPQSAASATLAAPGFPGPEPTAQVAVERPAAVPVLPALAVAEKPIRRIVIFYQDGTFSDFQPER